MPSSIPRNTTSFDRQVLWNPRNVLRVENDGRCVGWAPSKGRKCHNIVAGHNLREMDDLLRKLSISQPDADSRSIRDMLKQLAIVGLCVRNHRDQAGNMYETWRERIRHAFPEGAIGVTQSGQSTRNPSSTTPSLPGSDRAELDELHETICVLQRGLDEILTQTSRPRSSRSSNDTQWQQWARSIQSRLDGVSARATPQSPSQPRTTMPASSTTGLLSRQTPATSSTPPPDNSSRPPAEPSSSRNSTIQSHQPSVPSRVSTSSISSLNLSRASSSRTCRGNHVRRRTIDEECTICQADEPMSLQPLNHLVWCKAQCGRSVHKDCFESWRSENLVQRRGIKCVHCRADWVDCMDNCDIEWESVSDSESDDEDSGSEQGSEDEITDSEDEITDSEDEIADSEGEITDLEEEIADSEEELTDSEEEIPDPEDVYGDGRRD
ncbi:uncharacterized protein BDR25DRAFT_343888, partial [Lindgomyces ingoldianus]